MAGDWIKMTHALPEKPEVLAIAGRTGMSRFEVVGRLFTLWRWFDINTLDGNAAGVTSVTLNECLFGAGSVTNFVSAVIDARWLNESEDGVSVVKFDEHISESAKTRAQTAKRVAKSKAKAKGNAEGNADAVTPGVTKSVPREEKRREEKKSSPLRGGGGEESEGFTAFWLTWPANDRKQDKKKCRDRWDAEGLECLTAEILADVEAKKTTRKWTDDDGKFVEAPLVYLNNRRWEDGGAGARSPAQLVPGAI